MAENKITFTYNITDIQLLAWDVDATQVTDKMKWEPEPEVALDHLSKPDYSLVWLDVALFLGENRNEYAAMIKVRTIFSVKGLDRNKFPTSAIAWLMDFAIAHCRSICACKCSEEKISLTVIPYYTFKRLHEYASLCVFKPSVIALTHGNSISQKNISALAGSQVIGIDTLRTIILFFEPLPADHPESNLPGNREDKATINFNFDYERLPENEWKMYIDAGIEYATVAKIKVRTVYALQCTEKDLFTDDVLIRMIEETFKNCILSLKDQCKLNHVEFDGELQLGEEVFQDLSENAISQYYDSRKKDAMNNKALLQPGLSLTVGGNTRLVVRGTFMIMDEVMFLNPLFDRAHNRQVLAENIITDPTYYTVKYNCMEIETGPIQLSWMHTVIFYLCLDAAMQLLVSNHSETLQPVLLKNNFTEFRQEEFIRFGNDLFNSLNKSLKDSGMHITNLEDRRDWASLLR
ncbi:MAG: hypothetical protein ABIT08_02365 [Bacteroidia bacterium]